MFGGVECRHAGGDVLGRADPGAGARLGADRLHGESVRQHHMVTGLVQLAQWQFQARRIDAPAVTKIEESSGFVEGEDVLDAVAQALGDVARVIPERFRGVAGLPAADTVLQRLRQIPVIQRRVGLDAVLQEFIDQAVVEIEPLGVRSAASFRKHPRPRDRKPIGLDAEISDEADIFLVAVIMIVGAVGVAAVLDLARCMSKSVPDRTAAAVLVDGALDLIGRRGRAPDEILREWKRRVPLGRRLDVAIPGLCGRRRQPERGKAGDPGKMPARKSGKHRLLRQGSICQAEIRSISKATVAAEAGSTKPTP